MKAIMYGFLGLALTALGACDIHEHGADRDRSFSGGSSAPSYNRDDRDHDTERGDHDRNVPQQYDRDRDHDGDVH